MKKIGGHIFIVAALMACVHWGWADPISDNIKSHLNEAALDQLAEDLGAMIGGGSFHEGQALGFPIGLDVGVHATVVGIPDDDPILKPEGSRWGGVFAQAEVGLPAKLGVILRGGSLGSGTVLGGGLSYGLFKTSIPGLPNIQISGLYNQMEQDYVDVKTYSANAVMSFNIPFIHPYIGGGYDMTEVDPTSKAFEDVPGSPDTSMTGEGNGYRVEAGLNISLIPFTYVTAGVGLANGEEMYHLGAGARF